MQLQKSFGRHLSAWYSPRRAFGPGSQSENLVTGPPHFRHFPAGKVRLQIVRGSNGLEAESRWA